MRRRKVLWTAGYSGAIDAIAQISDVPGLRRSKGDFIEER
jgi:hypothetical protein